MCEEGQGQGQGQGQQVEEEVIELLHPLLLAVAVVRVLVQVVSHHSYPLHRLKAVPPAPLTLPPLPPVVATVVLVVTKALEKAPVDNPYPLPPIQPNNKPRHHPPTNYRIIPNPLTLVDKG